MHSFLPLIRTLRIALYLLVLRVVSVRRIPGKLFRVGQPLFKQCVVHSCSPRFVSHASARPTTNLVAEILFRRFEVHSFLPDIGLLHKTLYFVIPRVWLTAVS